MAKGIRRKYERTASGDISPGVQNQIASITKTYKHSLANLIQLQGNVLDLKRLLRYFINIFNRCTSSVNSPLRIREVDFKAGAKSKGSNGGVAVGLPHRNYSVFKQAHINRWKVKVVVDRNPG